MLCDEVTALLPGMVDGDADLDPAALGHVETCLRCQAEMARYRRLLRTLALLRTRYAEPTPGLLGETLAALTDAAEEGAPPHTVVGPPPRVRGCDRRYRGGRGRNRRAAHRPVATPLHAPRGLAAASSFLARRPIEAAAILARPDSVPKGSSSTGRAPVSKTGGWGFDSLLPCSRVFECGPRTCVGADTNATCSAH
jgi:hypothetical protein